MLDQKMITLRHLLVTTYFPLWAEFFNLKLTDILFTYFIANTKKINSLELTSDDFGICVEIPIKMSKANYIYSEIHHMSLKECMVKRMLMNLKMVF